MISVIIPVYREPESELASLLHWMEENQDWRVEWIVVQAKGDSSVLKQLGKRCDDGLLTGAKGLPVKVIEAKRGRSFQMNAGARHASGKVLVFLHADTHLERGWADAIEQIAGCSPRCWGAFTPRIADHGLLYRIAELWGLWRSRLLGLPYGDQALFVESSLFADAGSFDEKVQFMEELDLAGRLLKRKIRPLILPLHASTSSRKWVRHGILYSVKNVTAFFFYLTGISRHNICLWYKGNDFIEAPGSMWQKH